MRRIYKIVAGSSLMAAVLAYYYRRWKTSEPTEETLPPPLDEETRRKAYEAFATSIGKTYFGHTMPVWKPVYMEAKQTYLDHYEYIICIRIDETPWMGTVRFSKTLRKVIGCSPWIASYPHPPEPVGETPCAPTMTKVLDALRTTYHLPNNLSVTDIRQKGCFRRLDGSYVSHYHLVLHDQRGSLGSFEFSIDDDETVFNTIKNEIEKE